MARFSAFVVLAILLGGCASTSVVETGTRSYTAKPSDCDMKIFNSFPTDAKYEEIGIIYGKAGGSAFHGQGLKSLLPDMKSEACKLGADALILKGISESSYLEMYSGKRGEAQAVAIKILE